METSYFGILAKGGLIMIPLLICIFVAFTIVFERFYLFHRYFKNSEKSLPLIFKILQEGANSKEQFPLMLEKAKNLCQITVTPSSQVILAGLENFNRSKEEMSMAMENKAHEWLPLLEKRIDVLDTIITAAPMMGLLGTISGMMSAFHQLSQGGDTQSKLLTGGIGEALTATATGLIIALFCLFFFNYFNSKVKDAVHQMENSEAKMTQIKMNMND